MPTDVTSRILHPILIDLDNAEALLNIRELLAPATQARLDTVVDRHHEIIDELCRRAAPE